MLIRKLPGRKWGVPWAEGVSSLDAVRICTVTSQIKPRIQMSNHLALVSLFPEYLYPVTFHVLDWVGISGVGVALILAGLIYCVRGSSHLGLAPPRYLPMEARAQPHIQMSLVDYFRLFKLKTVLKWCHSFQSHVVKHFISFIGLH